MVANEKHWEMIIEELKAGTYKADPKRGKPLFGTDVEFSVLYCQKQIERIKKETEYGKLNVLRRKYKDLSAQNKTNTKEAKALLKQITTLDKGARTVGLYRQEGA